MSSGNLGSLLCRFLYIFLVSVSGTRLVHILTVEARGAPLEYMHLKHNENMRSEIMRIEELEKVQEELKAAITNLNKSIKEQETYIENLKKHQTTNTKENLGLPGGNAQMTGVSLDVCHGSENNGNSIEGAAQFNGRIYFVCSDLTYVPVYDALTLTNLFNISLPVTDCKMTNKHLTVNPKEGALYLISSCKSSSQTYGSLLWKMSTSETKWVPLNFRTNQEVRHIGPATDGQMLLASESHIYAYDSTGSISKTLQYNLPAQFTHSVSRRIIQTSRGSLLIPGTKSIAQLDSNGQYIDTYATGATRGSDKFRGDIVEISEGPADQILISENNRLLTLDLSTDTLNEFMTRLSSPRIISYEPKSQRLVVTETNNGVDSCKIYTLTYTA